jgi:hypothetical protein
MKSFKFMACVAVAASLIFGGIAGCTKKPNKEEVAKVEEAKSAAESAEKKLYDLKQERMKLEAEKEKNQKQGEEK